MRFHLKNVMSVKQILTQGAVALSPLGSTALQARAESGRVPVEGIPPAGRRCTETQTCAQKQ